MYKYIGEKLLRRVKTQSQRGLPLQCQPETNMNSEHCYVLFDLFVLVNCPTSLYAINTAEVI